MTLDLDRVVALARQQAPAVKVAEARIGEARALRVGARAPTTLNPEVGIAAGPRALSSGTIADVVGTLTLPIEVSGAGGVRLHEADERTRAAELEADDTRRLAVGAAVDAWLVALGADERVKLETERAQLDETLYTSARARRQAGTIGDFELQLAAVLRADGLARLRRAEGDREAALVMLRARLGLEPTVSMRLVGTLRAATAPALPELLHRMLHRPDRVRTQLDVEIADTDARLQRRLGVPAPRITAMGGRDGELFARFGVDVPLPVYQRNQTARAVAEARRSTATATRVYSDAAADSELRAAYATYLSTARAFEVLDTAAPSIADAEHLATRAYELGQTTLANLVVARRETATARVSYLEARIALARSRAALDVIAGVLP